MREAFKFIYFAMNELPDYQGYASLFDDYVKKQRLAILAFGILAVILFLIGIALILISFILGNLKENLLTELIKLGTGFISAGASYIPVKEIVDRRVSLVPYSFMKKRFDNSEKLSPAEQQLNIEIAKEFLRKKLT